MGLVIWVLGLLCVFFVVSYLFVELIFSLWVMSWGSNFDYAKI